MAAAVEEMEVDADVENQHVLSSRRKRPHLNGELHRDTKLKRTAVAVIDTAQQSTSGMRLSTYFALFLGFCRLFCLPCEGLYFYVVLVDI